MKKLLILAMTATMLAACTGRKVEGVVVKKTKITTDIYKFYTLSVLVGKDTIDCNVTHDVYKKYDVGDSVHEKYRYWAISAE